MKNTEEIRCVLVCRHCKMASLFVFLPGTDSETAAELIMAKSKQHDNSCIELGGDYNINIIKSNRVISTIRKEEI